MTPNPTSADLKARYPEFTQVPDPTVTLIIEEVSPMVDDGWEVSDQKPGVLALAAHVLSREGYPARAGAGGGTFDPTARPVVNRKVGDVSVTYGRTDGGAAEGASNGYNYKSTVYGQTFLRLLRLNVPSVALV